MSEMQQALNATKSENLKSIEKEGRCVSKTVQKIINGGGSNKDCYDPTVEDDDTGCYYIRGCQQLRCVLPHIQC